MRDAKAAEEEEERERERIAMLQIDWHDFAVVETIDFYDDEDEELPPPLSLKEVLVLSRQAADAALTAGGPEEGMQVDGAGAAAAAAGGAGQVRLGVLGGCMHSAVLRRWRGVTAGYTHAIGSQLGVRLHAVLFITTWHCCTHLSVISKVRPPPYTHAITHSTHPAPLCCLLAAAG